ncbi:MAG: hypothetical protein R3F65_13015 [bacterium]
MDVEGDAELDQPGLIEVCVPVLGVTHVEDPRPRHEPGDEEVHDLPSISTF